MFQNYDKSCKLGCLIKFVQSIMLTFPGHWGTQLWEQKQDAHNSRCTLGCIMQWSNIFHAESRPQLPLELQMTLIFLWRSSLCDFLREVIMCNVNFWRKKISVGWINFWIMYIILAWFGRSLPPVQVIR